jgi:hypothetical protein
MRPAPKKQPGRKDSIAVDWHDCKWSPRIAVQSMMAATTPRCLGLKPLPAPATHFTSYTVQFVHH